MSSVLPALRSPSIRDSAVDALRTALLEGKFQAGESLSEPSIAAQMGISRGPVREALFVLEQEGLVVHNQNRGFSVLRLGDEDRKAMVQVRFPLESLALEMARKNATSEDIEALEEISRRLVALYDEDMRLSAREDLAFHEKIWELSGNRWLDVALRRVVVPFFFHTIMFSAEPDGLDALTLDKQHALYIAYLRGETALTAADCVKEHLRMYKAE